MTQQFFARFLQKQHYKLADPARGKFRTFLLTSLQHSLVNEWEKQRAAKRGGGQENHVSLEQAEPEERTPTELVDDHTPEMVFERRWALTTLEAALTRLRQECVADAKAQTFDQLREFIWGEKSGASYAQIGMTIGMKEGAVKVAVHRLRSRFRAALRQEIAHTVAAEDQIDQELRHLIDVLSRQSK